MFNQSYYKKDSIKVDKTSKDWSDLQIKITKEIIELN